MALSETGATLARIKATTTVTWAQLAKMVGASSGDMVRQVARGSKPGNNLAANVAELMRTGEVKTAVPRRVTKGGKIAAVRAPTKVVDGKVVQGSRQPSENKLAAGTQRLFSKSPGGVGWTQTTGAPTDKGRGHLAQAVTYAVRRGQRVQLRVEVRPDKGGEPRWVEVGSKGGYTAKQITAGIRKHGSEKAWLHHQLAGRPYASGSILDVEVIAE